MGDKTGTGGRTTDGKYKKIRKHIDKLKNWQNI